MGTQSGIAPPPPATIASLAGVFDPRVYGAKGDGSHDDSTAIQSAINAASVAGGRVQLRPGTYKVGTGLTITAGNIHLHGSGIGATTLVSYTTGATITVNTPSNAVGGSLADFTVGPGPGITRASGVHEVNIQYMSQANIDRIQVAPQGGLCWGAFNFTSPGAHSSAIYCSGLSVPDAVRFATFSNVNDCYFVNCIGSNQRANGSAVAMIEFAGSYQEAICFTLCDFIGSATSGANNCCLHVADLHTRYCKFIGVYFDTAPTGVIIDAGSQVDFNGCWFSNRPGDGLVVNGGDNVHVVGGQAYNGGARGIAFLGGWGHLAQSVAVVATGQTTASPGISVGPGCTGARVLGCSAASADARFTGSITYGVSVDAAATNVIVEGNDFHLCSASMLATASSTVKIGSNNL